MLHSFYISSNNLQNLKVMLALWFLIILIAPIYSVVGEVHKGVLQALIFLSVTFCCKPHKTIFV